MITEVDEALRALIREGALGGGNDVAVVFDKPDEEWAGHLNGPTVNLFLYDVTENLARRETGYERVRDGDGRTTERRPPPRRFNLAYLVSVWTQRVEDEHRLLDDVLRALLSQEVIEDRFLPPVLAAQPWPVRIVAGRPRPDERRAADIWGAVGGSLRPSVDLLVTAPFVTGRRRPAGPPVVEEPRFDFDRAGDGGESSEGERRAASAAARHRAARERGGAASGAPLAGEVVHGGKLATPAPPKGGAKRGKPPEAEPADAPLDETPGRRLGVWELPRP